EDLRWSVTQHQRPCDRANQSCLGIRSTWFGQVPDLVQHVILEIEVHRGRLLAQREHDISDRRAPTPVALPILSRSTHSPAPPPATAPHLFSTDQQTLSCDHGSAATLGC